jgi:amidase
MSWASPLTQLPAQTSDAVDTYPKSDDHRLGHQLACSLTEPRLRDPRTAGRHEGRRLLPPDQSHDPDIEHTRQGHSLSRRRLLAGSGSVATGLAMAGLPGIRAAAATDAISDIVVMDALELSRAIKHRKVSCAEVMEAFLNHISRFNSRVNAIVSLADRDTLLKQAAERDTQLRQGRYLGWMHGFPHAVKDLADAKGFVTTQGSPIYKNRVATSDSLFVARLKAKGVIVIGKTNTPEWGFGSQTYNPVFGATVTPYDTSRTAGGSSGGAASALALRMLPVADGSDYMGSLRNPAAFNNVLGFRPSWGRVPASGFLAGNSVTGPMGRTVSDVAMTLSVMAGPDASAPLSLEQDPQIFTEPLKRDFRGTRIAWVGDWNGYLATEPGLLELCRGSFPAFESIGCVVEETLPPMPPEQLWTAWRTHRHWDNAGGYLYDLYANPSTRAQLKPEAVWEVENGLRLTGRDVSSALAKRTAWYAAVLTLFETYDYILAPSAQVFPFDATVHWPKEINGRTMDTYHRWMETVAPWSMTGLPAMGMPVGFDRRGLPMGVQLIGKNHADLSVLQLAYAYEQATRWVHKAPPPMLRT